MSIFRSGISASGVSQKSLHQPEWPDIHSRCGLRHVFATPQSGHQQVSADFLNFGLWSQETKRLSHWSVYWKKKNPFLFRSPMAFRPIHSGQDWAFVPSKLLLKFVAIRLVSSGRMPIHVQWIYIYPFRLTSFTFPSGYKNNTRLEHLVMNYNKFRSITKSDVSALTSCQLVNLKISRCYVQKIGEMNRELRKIHVLLFVGRARLHV